MPLELLPAWLSGYRAEQASPTVEAALAHHPHRLSSKKLAIRTAPELWRRR